MSPRRYLAALLLATAFALTTSASASADAFGPQLQITNQGPAGNIFYAATLPALAYNSRADEYLMVYVGSTSLSADDIYGRRLNAVGHPIGSPFKISTTALSNNELNPPGVAYDPDTNEYLVAWSNEGDEKVRVRRVTAAGGRIGVTESIINTNDQSDVEASLVAYNPQAKQYLVTWKGNDDNDGRVRGQLLTSSGAQVGPDDFEIGGAATLPADDAVGLVYNSTSHEYLAVFRAKIGDPSGEYEVFGQRVAANGTPVGPDDFRISDMGPDGNTSFQAVPPRVTWNSRLNQYLVVWTGDDDTAPLVDNELEVFGQLLNASGGEIGANDFRISDMGPNGNTAFGAFGVRAEYDPRTNQFLVVWHGDDNTPPLVDNKFEIFGQLLSAAGAQVGTNDFRISHMPPEGAEMSDAFRPTLAYNSKSCTFLTAWFRGSSDHEGQQGDSDGESEVFDRQVAAGPSCAVAPPPGPPGADTSRPVIRSLKVTPGTIGTASTDAVIARRLARKAKISYRLSEAAKVRFTIQLRTIGRKVGKSCRKKTRRNKSRRRCVRYVKVGRSFSQKGKAGKNSKRFSRKTVHKRKLRAGRYRVAVRASDAAGNRSKLKRAKFRVKKVKKVKKAKPRGRP